LPAGIDTTKPFGLHPQNPWPNALILDTQEQDLAKQAIDAYNSTIASVTAAKGAYLVDIYAFLNQVKAQGYLIQGEIYSTAYITGGLFSLDGVHPSSRGHAIIANEFIKVMNARLGMSIPLVDLSRIPGIPAPKYASDEQNLLQIPLSAFKNFDWVFQQSELR
jgi:hypothetical protein